LKRIGIYFFCVVALGCVTSSILYRQSEKANEIRLEKADSEGSEETSSEAEGTVELDSMQEQEELIEVSDAGNIKERFFVTEEDGYLVIYDRQSMRRYDDTTIQVTDLPERLQKEIETGLYFSNEEALYAFLETYSS